MRISGPLLATLTLAGCLAGCAGSPPRELDGLWGAGPAACDAGIGVRFGGGSIDAHYAGEQQALLDRPRYELERRGERVRVRIRYMLPHNGAAALTPIYGILVLERGGDGWLRALIHREEDPRTGAARVRLGADPIAATFRLRKCEAGAWIEGLRGRRA